MPRYGETSKKRLQTAHKDLQRLFNAVIERTDISITCGKRNEEQQNALYPEFSRVEYPNSKHNQSPSHAVDFAPWINHAKSEVAAHYIYAAGIIMTIAEDLRIEVRWGGNWDRDLEVVTDQDFKDLGHIELVNPY